MKTFLRVTEILMDNIADIFEPLFSATSSLLAVVGLMFCVILVVRPNNEINKKYFLNNKKFILITLIIEILACLFASDINTVKFNFLVLAICLIVLLIKGSKPNKKIVKTIKKENEESNESIQL